MEIGRVANNFDKNSCSVTLFFFPYYCLISLSYSMVTYISLNGYSDFYYISLKNTFWNKSNFTTLLNYKTFLPIGMMTSTTKNMVLLIAILMLEYIINLQDSTDNKSPSNIKKKSQKTDNYICHILTFLSKLYAFTNS